MKTHRINLPSDRRVCLIGAGDAARLLCRHLVQNDVDVRVITNDALDRSWALEIDPPLVDLASEAVEVEAKSSQELLAAVKSSRANIAVVAGWPAIIGSDVRSQVGDRIFNFHLSSLPKFRGAATSSWAILLGTETVGVAIHQLTGKLDSGPVWLKIEERPTEVVAFPIDYLRATYRLAERVLLPEFSKALREQDVLVLSDQDESVATYFPALHTPVNGVLQFDWSPDETDRFVRAFGDPFSGARFYYKDTPFVAKGSRVVQRTEQTHPFVRGLITHRTESEIWVHVTGGVVSLGPLFDLEGGPVSPKNFRIGDRLRCPPEARDASLEFRST